MAIRSTRAECFVEGDAQVGDGLGDTGQARTAQSTQHAAQELVAQGVDLFEHACARRRDPDEHDPPVLRDPRPLDEPAFLDAIDQTGGIRQRDVEHVGEPAHRHLAFALEGEEDVELGHADAESKQAFARCALHARHGRPEVGDDGTVRIELVVGGTPFRCHRDGSCHVNYVTQVDHPVNRDD